MKLTLAAASFMILCTAASAQTATPETYSKDPACKATVEKVCPGVKPGGGRIRACLKQNNTTFKQLCPGDVGKKKAGTSMMTTPPTAAPMAAPPAGQ